MDIRVLKYLVTAVRSGSISAALKELFITQPTLTRQFFELEAELGQRLLERSAHGIALTNKGRIFYRRACEILEQTERLKAEIRCEESLSGIVSMGLAETPAVRLLANRMSALLAAHPLVRFDEVSAVRDTVVDGI